MAEEVSRRGAKLKAEAAPGLERLVHCDSAARANTGAADSEGIMRCKKLLMGVVLRDTPIFGSTEDDCSHSVVAMKERWWGESCKLGTNMDHMRMLLKSKGLRMLLRLATRRA